MERTHGSGGSTRPRRPVRFPPGEPVLEPRPFQPDFLAAVDTELAAGRCPEGRLDLEAEESRLTCLIRRSAPFAAGLLERDVFSRIPLYDFAIRARQLEGASASLRRTDVAQVMMEAVHFSKRPSLQAPTRLVNPAHVLEVLARDQRDAALAFERSGTRTLLFLHQGKPARLYFGEPREDPAEGTLEDRILLFAFAPSAPETLVEVFTSLKLPSDPDEGTSFTELDRSVEPPAVEVLIHLESGREVRRRPFTAPEMIIGRDPAVDLFIDNLAVSRKHARLLWERGGFAIEDLQSANGTSVNGQPVTRARLSPADRIEICKFVVTLREHASPPRVSETLYLAPTDLFPPAYLIGDRISRTLDRDLLFGRGQGVDIEVAGLFVRPVHCRITRHRSGSLEVICFGRATVRINGKKTAGGPLAVGDRLAVGRSRFVVSSERRPPRLRAAR